MSMGPNTDEMEFDYKPKLAVVFLSTFMFGAAAMFFVYLATSNQQGLIIEKFIELSVNGATAFYWVLAALSFVMVIMVFYSLINSFRHKRSVLVTRESISAPKSGISRKIINVRFRDIENMRVEKVHKTQILTIKHTQGKLSIPNSMIPGLNEFENLLTLITQRYQESQSKDSA